MSSPVSLTTDQEVAYGVSLFAGKPPVAITDKSQLPPGWGVSFESSNTAVASIVMRPDGLNCDVHSDGVGVATITGRVTKDDGTDLPGSPDTMEVSVKNAAPGQATFTVGAPAMEDDDGS